MYDKCLNKCEFAIGSYPTNGLVRASRGNQTYVNSNREEKMCFLSNINIFEKNKIVKIAQSSGNTGVKAKNETLEDICKNQCNLEYYNDWDFCFNFHKELGYTMKNTNFFSFDNTLHFIKFYWIVVLILLLLTIVFLVPENNSHIFFMLIEFLQLYYIWGLKSQKSSDSKQYLTQFKYVSFAWVDSWLLELFAKIFKTSYTIIAENNYSALGEQDFRRDKTYISYLEDYFQYKKNGYFIFDCAPLLEFYIYAVATGGIVYLLSSVFKKCLNKDNRFLKYIAFVAKNYFSLRMFLRLSNETYLFILLHGVFMELFMDLPINTSKQDFLINYPYVIMNKIILRVMMIGIGFGYPIYIIIKILGLDETVGKPTNGEEIIRSISGCEKAKGGDDIFMLSIIRKILMVFYVLPMFNGGAVYLALLLFLLQIILLTLLVVWRPYKTALENIIAILANVCFLFTSIILFLNSIIDNYNMLIYIISEDYGLETFRENQKVIEAISSAINDPATIVAVSIVLALFSGGIIMQALYRIRLNLRFGGSIFKSQEERQKRITDVYKHIDPNLLEYDDATDLL